MSTSRSSHWSLTINNPTSADDEEIAMARQKGWRVTGQKEKGENGTEHYQLHLQTPQVRFSAVKKAFSRAHIEVARNPQALEAYVSKAETRVGSLPVGQERYPSLSRFWTLVYDEIWSRNWLHIDGDTWFKDAFFDNHYSQEAYMRSSEARQEFAKVVFDCIVEHLISQGYHVDQFYSPPNQNLWKKFHFAILQRSHMEKMAQTASQTDGTRLVDENEVEAQEYNSDASVSSQVSPQV